MTLRTALLVGAAVLAPVFAAHAGTPFKHVLLIEIDGMHRVDFQAWNHYANFGIGTDPLRTMLLNGFTFTNAVTSAPSNAFPGMIAQVTGSTPKSSGVYYDTSYDRSYYGPGSNCAGSAGAPVPYNASIDAQPIPQPPASAQIDITKLPERMVSVGGVSTCQPVLPHQFLNVNTIFEVAKSQIPGAHTAWADIHPSYEILNGPSGTGVDDLYTPEINATNPNTGKDYTQSYIDSRTYDLMNVNAVINEVNGMNSTGTTSAPIPTIFGMSFESVTVGQQLATAGSDDPTPPSYFNTSPYNKPPFSAAQYYGGYITASPTGAMNGACVLPGWWNSALVSEQYGCPGVTGNPVTQLSALDFVSYEIGQIVLAMGNVKSENLLQNTLIIVTSRTGDSPIDRKTRFTVPPTNFNKLVFNNAKSRPAPAFADYDDVALVWLNPATRTMTTYDNSQASLMNDMSKLHLQYVLGDSSLSSAFNSPFSDNRVPDFIGIPVPGTLYLNPGDTTLAKAGGFSEDDRDVMLMMSKPVLPAQGNPLPGAGNPGVFITDNVETRQIAPTILYALGIKNYSLLQGVAAEGTQPLPVTLY